MKNLVPNLFSTEGAKIKKNNIFNNMCKKDVIECINGQVINCNKLKFSEYVGYKPK
jgi:hypothetical protein